MARSHAGVLRKRVQHSFGARVYARILDVWPLSPSRDVHAVRSSPLILKLQDIEHCASRLMSHELRECKEESMNALNRMLQLEEGPLLTQNGHYYETVRRKWLAHYRWVRYNPLRYLRSPPSPASEASHVPYAQPERAPSPYRDARDVPREKSAKDKALEALAELGYGDLSVGDLSRLHPPNQFDEELTVMADVRAYFQVAYKVSRIHHLIFHLVQLN